MSVATALDDAVSEIRTSTASSSGTYASQSEASWCELLLNDATRLATTAHWGGALQSTFAYLAESYRNVVVVGDRSRADVARFLNVALADPALFDAAAAAEEEKNNSASARLELASSLSQWSGVIKVVHGANRQFRLVSVGANSSSSVDATIAAWHSFDDSEGRALLRSRLRAVAIAAPADIGISLELRTPAQRLGVALFDCSRIGGLRLDLLAQYVRNADVVLWVTTLDWSPPTPREAAILDIVAADRARCFVAADFSFDKRTFTFDRFLASLRVRWPTLFADDTALHHFSFALAEQAVLRQRLIDVAAAAAANSAPAAPAATEAESAAMVQAQGLVENVRHALAKSDDRRAAALVARRLVTLSHEVSLFASLCLNQGQSVRKREHLRRETSLQGIEAALGMLRQLLESARDATAATASEAFVQHCDAFLERFLMARHSASSAYAAMCDDFKQHVHVFGAEFEALCRTHADSLRRAVLDTLAACESHGAPPCDVDVDWLARSICRQRPGNCTLPRGWDADGIALTDFTNEPVMLEIDGELVVPIVTPIVSSLLSWFHDNRGDFRAEASFWRDKVRSRLVAAVMVTTERRNAACQSALARVLELARLQLRIAQLDLELMKDSSEQARDISTRLQHAVTGARTAREELEQLLEALVPVPPTTTTTATVTTTTTSSSSSSSTSAAQAVASIAAALEQIPEVTETSTN
jgi:hypothetical protein